MHVSVKLFSLNYGRHLARLRRRRRRRGRENEKIHSWVSFFFPI